MMMASSITLKPRASASARRDGSQSSCPTEPTARKLPSGMMRQSRSYCSRGVDPGQLGGKAGSSERVQVVPLSADTKTGQSPMPMWSPTGEEMQARDRRPSGSGSRTGKAL